MARAVIAPILIMLAVLAASAQGDVNSVRTRLERRFEVLPIADGVVLTPRFKTTVRSIEVTASTIALDGTAVTGAELRERLGDDADAVLQVSYLDADARRSLGRAQQTASPKPVDSTAPTLDPRSTADPGDRPRRVQRDDIVRIGGSVEINSDEHITGDVVAIGGSARVDGQVDGEVVVIGGSLELGPNAVVRRDVVVVGGALRRDPNAVLNGKVQEVGFDAVFGPNWGPRDAWARWNPMGAFYPFARFMGTLVRVGLLMLLAGLVILVARTPVEQIAARAAAEPVKSWAVGFLVEILFVPILVFTVIVLAISIIGIPLLLLVPVAIVAMMIVFLVGFTGVAYQLGRVLEDRIDWLRASPYAATLAGILLILSPLIVARVLGLTGAAGVIVWMLVSAGFIAEYIAWTTGLGAAALSRFGRQVPPPSAIVAERPMITT
jgi:hypothetical protein